MSQISERINLSSFVPLTQSETWLNSIAQAFRPVIPTNKLNLNSNYFLRNVHNSRFIYTYYILPLYRSFKFNLIKTKYNVILTSNNQILFTSTDKDVAQAKLKEYDLLNKPCLLQTTFEYTKDHTPLLKNEYNEIPWADTFNGTRRALRYLDTPQSMLKEYFRWCGLSFKTIFEDLLSYSIRIVLPFFDKLKQVLHTNISKLPPEVRYFFDIPTMAGFPKMENRLMTDDPYLWLTNETKSEFTANWWCDAFYKTFGQAVIRSPQALMTLKEFALARWMWVTEGASRFSKLIINDERVKTKLGAAASLTDNEILKLVDDATARPTSLASIIGVFIKPDEKGYKRRLIANVPLGGYIIAAYIRYLIESFVGTTPLFMKLSPTNQDNVDVITLLQQKRLALPLDESAYDYNVTRESWLGFIQFLERMFPGNTGVLKFKNYFNIAYWEFDGDKGKWRAGMPSGLALTSFVNSWMNYIKQGFITPGIFNWAAGDDVLTFPYNDKITLEDISQEYAKFGAVANPIKNWKSRRYAEYLKRFYSSTGTSGYPARIWASLMFAGNERFYLPSDKLPELAELFKQFFDRIGLKMDERYVAKDLARAVSSKIPHFNMYTALDWLHSPRVHGGFGKLPYNNKTFTWNVEHKTYDKIENNLIRLPRGITYSGQVSLNIGTYKLNNAGYRQGSSYKLLPIESISDWEKRLNREDIDYHGPFQSLVLDVIPLPCVDFISTSLMSSFASEHLFNSFPNLHGTWNTIASRLVRASWALVQQITDFLNNYHIITYV